MTPKNIDYDLDRYGNRIRKYKIVGFEKIHGRRYPIWREVPFKPETGYEHVRFNAKVRR